MQLSFQIILQIELRKLWFICTEKHVRVFYEVLQISEQLKVKILQGGCKDAALMLKFHL